MNKSETGHKLRHIWFLRMSNGLFLNVNNCICISEKNIKEKKEQEKVYHKYIFEEPSDIFFFLIGCSVLNLKTSIAEGGCLSES